MIIVLQSVPYKMDQYSTLQNSVEFFMHLINALLSSQ